MEYIKDILKSGKLEEYVLGLLDDNESELIESLIKKHPEVKSRVRVLESSLEGLAKANKIDPHPELKNIVFNSLLESNNPSNNSAISKWITFTSLAASLILGVLLINVKQSNSSLNKQLTSLMDECEKIQFTYQVDEELLYFLRHEATVPVQLDNAERNANLMVYFNPVAKQSMVKINELPQLASNETYQLWADVDGKMIDMGIFNLANAFIPMKYISNPESFNITIEPSGGSDHPTVSRLVASQKV